MRTSAIVPNRTWPPPGVCNATARECYFTLWRVFWRAPDVDKIIPPIKEHVANLFPRHQDCRRPPDIARIDAV